MYVSEPENPSAFTATFESMYSRFGRIYDFLVKHTPIWKSWISPAIAHINGPRVLEVSFGTGWLLTQYADQFQTFGIDLNMKLILIASKNLAKARLSVPLIRGNVEALPYRSASFDTIVNTMAFSGYPRADKSIEEMHRILKPGGRLVLIDVAPPPNGNWLGTALIKIWIATGDIIRDMNGLLLRHGFDYSHEIIAGFGSVHLYVATKRVCNLR